MSLIRKCFKKLSLISAQRGIGLIETMLSLALAIIIITALVSLSVFTLRTVNTSNLLMKSSKLATEELELVRAYRDKNNWTTFVSGVTSCTAGAHCYITSGLAVAAGNETLDPWNTPSFAGDDITRFFYVTNKSNPVNPVTLIGVYVGVTWTVGNQAKSAFNYTELSNWRD